MGNSTKISVLIPVYNVEQYLAQCLDSVINQTYKNIEIICVDDGSTDNSLAILNEYANKDSRIKVINKDNGGLASARNEGLKHITGELCYFLDSDDYILPDLFNYAIKIFNNFDIDYFCFGSEAFVDDKHSSNIIQNKIALIDYIKVKRDGLFDVDFDVVKNTNIHVWNKIFKTSIIRKNNIYFIDGLLYEDIYFMWLYAFVSKKAYFEQKTFHKYRIRENSIMEQTTKEKSLTSGIDHLFNWYELLKKTSQNKNMFLSKYNNLLFLLEIYKIRTKEMISDDEKVYVELLVKRYRSELESIKEKYTQIEIIPAVEKMKYSFLEKIFSVKSSPDKKRKIIRLMFLKIKLDNRYRKMMKYLKNNCVNKNNIKYSDFCNSNNTDERIFNAVKKLGKFSFLSNRGNIGDMAIATSCYQYFDTHRFEYDVIDMTEYKKLLEKQLNVVYGGGGLFTGYYRQYYQEILEIFKSKNVKNIVILPASFYDCDEVLECFDERFTVFCREKQSLDYCLSKNNKAKFVLADDMAFSMNVNFLNSQIIDKKNIKTNMDLYKDDLLKPLYNYYLNLTSKFNRVLNLSSNIGYFFRTDKENVKNVLKDVYSLIDISLSANSFCADKAFTLILVREFLKMLNKYEYIVTDRLHVGICSMLLGKNVFLLDNTYKKVSKVFENSIIGNTNVKIYDNFENLQKELPNKAVFTPIETKLEPLSFEDFIVEYLSIKNNFGCEKIYWEEIL